MKNYQSLIEPGMIPKHVAVIMDGNGRWAKKKSLPRREGHRMGAEVIEPLMDAAIGLGIRAVSLYAFSTENWQRPRSEVTALWELLEHFFTTKIDTIKEKDIRVKHSGMLKRLPPSSKRVINRACDETAGNKTLVLNFCLNYGGRQEIVSAVNQWLEKSKPKERISLKKLERHLYTSDLPEVDLLIRTSGEFRISNFLIWQLAYAELVFLDVLWPDFKPHHLYKSVYLYQQRERRFGAL